ncbi:WxL protein peptidoglycan domain-containing protein [Streptomyces sp. NPDC050418]|uniref:WxL protein peptidoglycan domain-containing protein n=1 Tax=Streptomyces sp. NPDC050418 TaxID=3365612 RepID=UPI0037A92974
MFVTQSGSHHVAQSGSKHATRTFRPYAALVAAFSLVAALLLTAGAPAPAYAADNGRWSVYPSSGQPGGRPYFFLMADPGTTLKDKVTVTNKADEPLTFKLYASDAYNTPRDGGFAVRALGEKQRGIGAWAKPAKSRVTVPPKKSLDIPLTIKVPESAEPGDHPGALVALDEQIDPAEGSVEVGVQRAVGARIYLRVGGPTVPGLSVENVKMKHDKPLVPGFGKSTATITYTLHNRGNVTLNPKVELTAKGLFGRKLLDRDLTKVPAELLPLQKVELTERWSGAPQLDWGDVELTATSKDVKTTGSTSFLALPWLVAGAILAILLGGVSIWVAKRRKARATAA